MKIQKKNGGVGGVGRGGGVEWGVRGQVQSTKFKKGQELKKHHMFFF